MGRFTKATMILLIGFADALHGCAATLHAATGRRAATDREPPWLGGGRFQPQRRSFAYAGTVGAPPAEVFPLLCPVREYEWLPDWRCTMVYSESGVAETGAVFQTRIDLGETWVTTRHEQDRALEAVIFGSGHVTVRFAVHLTDRGDSTTSLRWSREYTSLDRLGDAAVKLLTDEGVTSEMRRINEQLDAFLGAGGMRVDGS